MDLVSLPLKDVPGIDDLILCRHHNALSTELDQETVILSLQSGIYSQLNPVASIIWELLAQPITLATVMETITSTYDTTGAQFRPEVLAFVGDLAEQQLITIRHAPPR